ncbi:MAG: MFS transporter [Sinimarinibacterium flocculans]|uniref:MFS transporter n=1 Tax=Sinimarinibacterium flocculans TaxID=985250 RepID=UPI003C49FB92
MTGVLRITELIDSRPLGRLQFEVATLCALVALLDGFDTQVIAYVAPAITEQWGMAPSALGPVFGAGLLGLMAGALIGGPLADRWGRKWTIVVSTLLFGAFALATAWAQTPGQLLALRLLTGLGLGSAMPNLIALTSEYAPARLRTMLVTLMFCGFPLGSILGGVLSALWIPSLGWPSLFLLGGAAPLLLALVLAWRLPESPGFLLLRRAHSRELQRVLDRLDPRRPNDLRSVTAGEPPEPGFPLRELFRGSRTKVTVLLWTAFFMNLLVMYFMVNWLPTLLTLAGYSLSLAILASSLLNLGGIGGGILLATLVRRYGPYLTLGTAFVLVGGIVAALANVTAVPRLTMPAIFLAGAGVVGAQFCLNALAAETYPTAIRATGVGWALGIGRTGSVTGPLLGGVLLGWGWSPDKLVLACSIPALVTAAAILGLARLRARDPDYFPRTLPP